MNTTQDNDDTCQGFRNVETFGAWISVTNDGKHDKALTAFLDKLPPPARVTADDARKLTLKILPRGICDQGPVDDDGRPTLRATDARIDWQEIADQWTIRAKERRPSAYLAVDYKLVEEARAGDQERFNRGEMIIVNGGLWRIELARSLLQPGRLHARISQLNGTTIGHVYVDSESGTDDGRTPDHVVALARALIDGVKL
jgi:hypothetical protein